MSQVLPPSKAKPILHIAMEEVFGCDSLGRYFSPTIYSMPAWEPYLECFAKIRLIVRVQHFDYSCDDIRVLDPALVEIVELPKYKGGIQLVRRLPQMARLLRNEVAHVQVANLVLPGAIASTFGLLLLLHRVPFGVRVVGDIDEVIKTGNFGRLVGALRVPIVFLTRFLCRKAAVAAYVTNCTLQKKYPGGVSTKQISFSDLNLPPSAFVDYSRAPALHVPPRLLFCGSLEQLYKGLDTLIAAVALLPRRYHTLGVRVLGDGLYRSQLEALAHDSNVSANFSFLGNVPREEVLSEMTKCDLFVMPSRTEGLPRAMIEAMAQGLPCIGSRVGGIPELLSDEALFQPDDATGLANRISEFLDYPALRRRQGQRNLQVARHFEPISLRRRLFEYLTELAALGDKFRSKL